MCVRTCKGCNQEFKTPPGYENNLYCKSCYLKQKNGNENSYPVVCHLTDTDKSIICQTALKSLIGVKGLTAKKEEIMSEAIFYASGVISWLSGFKKNGG